MVATVVCTGEAGGMTIEAWAFVGGLVATLYYVIKWCLRRMDKTQERCDTITDKFSDHVSAANAVLGKIADQVEEIAKYQKSNQAALLNGQGCRAPDRLRE